MTHLTPHAPHATFNAANAANAANATNAATFTPTFSPAFSPAFSHAFSHACARVASRVLAAAALPVLALVVATSAQAGSHNMLPRTPLVAYQQECAACHMAYAPGFLPAQSWTHMMGGLDKHYGTDASLDAATVQQISTWLNTHAGTYKRVAEAPPDDRMTRSAWFERKHRKIDPQVWQHAAVKSRANCMACHTRADKGNYDDDSVSFPAGLPLRYRLGWRD